MRILTALNEERTTKQVAELLHEKPTRLYHHVDALERACLVQLTQDPAEARDDREVRTARSHGRSRLASARDGGRRRRAR